MAGGDGEGEVRDGREEHGEWKFGKAGVDGRTRCEMTAVRRAEWKVRPVNFGVVEFQVGKSVGWENAGFTGRCNGENHGVGGGIPRGNREEAWDLRKEGKREMEEQSDSGRRVMRELGRKAGKIREKEFVKDGGCDLRGVGKMEGKLMEGGWTGTVAVRK